MSLKVLVVDDEAGYCALISRILRPYGFKITTCHESNCAVDLLMNEHFDLLITDLHMPGMTGYDLTELAGRLPGTPSILVVTAQKALLEEAPKRLRNVQCLLKPLTLEDFRAKISLLTGCWPNMPTEASEILSHQDLDGQD
jgi:CheY-like chemotaxis protein